MWPIPDRGLGRRLYRVRAKTLVIHGADDAFVPVQYARDFATALPDCEVKILEGGAHMLPVEAPDDVMAAISRFLEARS
jgi:pimeloyl-ACP methyl ester carboxylesterase